MKICNYFAAWDNYVADLSDQDNCERPNPFVVPALHRYYWHFTVDNWLNFFFVEVFHCYLHVLVMRRSCTCSSRLGVIEGKLHSLSENPSCDRKFERLSPPTRFEGGDRRLHCLSRVKIDFDSLDCCAVLTNMLGFARWNNNRRNREHRWISCLCHLSYGVIHCIIITLLLSPDRYVA